MITEEDQKKNVEETEVVEEEPAEEIEEETEQVEVEKEELAVEKEVEGEKEEVKPSREKEEEEIVEERVYTIPLDKAWIMPPNKRAPRAIRIVKSFITKHMKLEKREEEEEAEETKKLVITNEVNEKIWSRGIEKPPRKIRVRAAKDKEGIVTVYLAEGD